MWMTSCTGSARGGLWGFWKKSAELSLAVRRRRVTFASSQWPCGERHTCWGGRGRWKSHHRKIVHLSSLCRNLQLEGNKRFRTWTKKSLRVFRVSGFLCSMYICYEHSMYVSPIFRMAMFPRVYDNFKCLYRKVWKLIEGTSCLYIYIYIYIYMCVKRKYYGKLDWHISLLEQFHQSSVMCCLHCRNRQWRQRITEDLLDACKMYDWNYQESTTILNACTKKSGNLLKAPRVYIYIYIYMKRKYYGKLDWHISLLEQFHQNESIIPLKWNI